MLQVNEFHGPHTGMSLIENIEEMLVKWNIQHSRCFARHFKQREKSLGGDIQYVKIHWNRISTWYWLIPKAQVPGPISICNWAQALILFTLWVVKIWFFEPGDFFVGTWAFISASAHLSMSPTIQPKQYTVCFSPVIQINQMHYAHTTFKFRRRKYPFYFWYVL